jgi:hypothetical protein
MSPATTAPAVVELDPTLQEVMFVKRDRNRGKAAPTVDERRYISLTALIGAIEADRCC